MTTRSSIFSFTFTLLTTLVLLFSYSCKKNTTSSMETKKTAPQYQASIVSGMMFDTQSGLSKQVIIMETSKGKLTFALYPNDAPETVKRFIELTNSNFYKDIKFHRVITNFVVQGGDPTGTGMGGSGKKLKAEFNKRNHIRGTLAMARQSDPDSADSQFYIALSTLPHLDGKYTVFGQIVDGDKILDSITQDDKILSITYQSTPNP